LFGLGSSLFARRAPLLGAVLAITALVTSALVSSSRARAEKAGTDRAQMAQLERAIATKGAEIEALVANMNPARAKLAALHIQVNRDEQLLATDYRSTRAELTFASAVGPAFFERRSSTTQAMSERHSLDSVKSHLDESIAKLELAKASTGRDRRQVLTRRVDAQNALEQLTQVQTTANAAITAAKTTVSRVSADLTARLVDRRHRKEAQALRASEHAITAAFVVATQTEHAASHGRRRVSTPRLASRARRRATSRRAGNGYANPFRAISGLTPERIDQGVDYAGAGPVYAIGNGVVLNAFSSGWPNGTFIAYRLTDGPARGLVVFTAEDLSPQVSVGSTVKASTVIGQMFRGPHGIEIGWADGSAIPNAMARSFGQYREGVSTAFGNNFSRLLQSVGAPAGILNNAPTGTLPTGWPQW
jgi:murein DD-endopeptidase MepM/ murein hydrolase activator NlpD